MSTRLPALSCLHGSRNQGSVRPAVAGLDHWVHLREVDGSSRLSFDVFGAVLVQIGSYWMETMDGMDINPPYLWTGWT